MDGRGRLHFDPACAIVTDIAASLGRVGDEGGLMHGIARFILEKRSEIEAAFSVLDKFQGTSAQLFEMSGYPRIQTKST